MQKHVFSINLVLYMLANSPLPTGRTGHLPVGAEQFPPPTWRIPGVDGLKLMMAIQAEVVLMIRDYQRLTIPHIYNHLFSSPRHPSIYQTPPAQLLPET